NAWHTWVLDDGRATTRQAHEIRLSPGYLIRPCQIRPQALFPGQTGPDAQTQPRDGQKVNGGSSTFTHGCLDKERGGRPATIRFSLPGPKMSARICPNSRSESPRRSLQPLRSLSSDLFWSRTVFQNLRSV